MNQVVKISIAGIGFTLDDHAYEELSRYIDSLEIACSDNPDRKEIINDIEARIVELILSRQSPEEIVHLSIIQEIIGQLGLPEDIGHERTVSTDSGLNGEHGKFPRRLYRDPDGAILGGVCTGLATFFRTGVVWIRLAIFLPLLLRVLLPSLNINFLDDFFGALFGSFVLLYFIMWIAVPLPKTPRQKLEMQGRPVTARTIEEEIAGENSVLPEHARRSASAAAGVFVALSRIVIIFLKIIMLAIALVFALGALSVFIAMVTIPFTTELLEIPGVLLFDGLNGIAPGWFLALVMSLLAIPMFMLAYQASRVVFRFRNNRTLMWILGGAWIGILIYVGVLIKMNSENFVKNVQNIRTEVVLSEIVDPHFSNSVRMEGNSVMIIDLDSASISRIELEYHRNEFPTAKMDTLETGEVILKVSVMERGELGEKVFDKVIGEKNVKRKKNGNHKRRR